MVNIYSQVIYSQVNQSLAVSFLFFFISTFTTKLKPSFYFMQLLPNNL